MHYKHPQIIQSYLNSTGHSFVWLGQKLGCSDVHARRIALGEQMPGDRLKFLLLQIVPDLKAEHFIPAFSQVTPADFYDLPPPSEVEMAATTNHP